MDAPALSVASTTLRQQAPGASLPEPGLQRPLLPQRQPHRAETEQQRRQQHRQSKHETQPQGLSHLTMAIQAAGVSRGGGSPSWLHLTS